MRIVQHIQQLWIEKPLQLVMFVAIVTRLIASLFSKGFGMHDDHFLVVEAAQAWADGVIVPGQSKAGEELIPDGHSLFYMGLHYLLFKFFNLIHITNLEIKMFVVRLIHAAASVYSVWLTYKITERLSSFKDAALAGLLMAALWFLPMLSVRNLVEIFCIPFTLTGVWLMILAPKKQSHLMYYFLAGIVLGISFSVRFQLIVFVGGAGLVLMIQRKWIATLLYGFGVLISILLLQGLVDYYIWGYMFAELIEYVKYNLQAAYDYITGPWYNYILLLAGILLPPISLMLLFGYFRIWKKHLIIFLPSFLFLLFHSFFPNKQERFIFPIIPYIVIGGIIGWNSFILVSKYWFKHRMILQRAWIFFWVMNLILLIPVTISYSKRSRVEAMTYLSKYKNIKLLVAEDTNYDYVKMLPRFYSGQWMQVVYKSSQGMNHYEADSITSVTSEASFVLFFSDKNLNARIDSMKKEIPSLEYETTISPGFIDNVMHKLNPVNRNETIYIYRNGQKVENIR